MPEVALSPLAPTETVTVWSAAYVFVFEKVAVTVTVVASAPSVTLDRFTDRFTAGAVSSSVSVRSSPFTVSPVALPPTPMVSPPSTRVSCVGVSVNVPVPLVSPFAIVTSKSATAA